MCHWTKDNHVGWSMANRHTIELFSVFIIADYIYILYCNALTPASFTGASSAFEDDVLIVKETRQ